jgi:hypothetical protein
MRRPAVVLTSIAPAVETLDVILMAGLEPCETVATNLSTGTVAKLRSLIAD